jgi:hypothetical protein
MAKKKRYPKQPKEKASLSTWENYHAKCKDVDKFNADLDKDAKKKDTVKSAVKKLKSKRK